MAMKKTPPCRLDIIFAAEADKAVILRRGPTRYVRMIAWNTKDDTFEDGQWVKHRVYERKCSLSPDGAHFAYFAFSSSPREGAYVFGGFAAVSKVPYFTAVGMIIEGSTWSHGGRFIDNVHVYCPFLHSDDISPLPAPLRWVWHPLAYGVGYNDRPPRRDKAPEHFLLASGKPAPIDPASVKRFLAAWPPIPRAPSLPDWCAVDSGCLYRVTKNGDREMLRDFNAMEFERIQAPYEGINA